MTRRDVVATTAALALGVAASALLTASPAFANSGGITRRSGKQGPICNACHGGGVPPEVRFIGPPELTVGEMATYRFEVQSFGPNQSAAGFNVAASGGTLAVLPGQGARRANNELTHAGPKGNVDGVAAWEFTWTAPEAPGVFTLFGAGNSVNRSRNPNGDGVRATTFDIAVLELQPPTFTPTPTEPPAPSPTATPIVPRECTGDCNGSGDVAVNELIAGVNIALGNSALDTCPDIDANGDDLADIGELIAAVNSTLHGCIR